MGKPVAIHSTALQADAVNIGVLDMDGAKTVEEALDVMNRFGAPPQNVVAADADGRIGWTYCGRIPVRKGFDGSTAESWGRRSNRLGRLYSALGAAAALVDPPEGFPGDRE